MYKKLILLLLLMPACINAYCSNEELSRYKSLAFYINNYYEFNEDTHDFHVHVYNLSSELSILNVDTGEMVTPSSSGITEFDFYNLKSGTVKLGFYPSSGGCSMYRVRTVYVNLPYYNSYYDDPVCINNKNSLCSKWVNTSMYSYEEFVDRVSVKSGGSSSTDSEIEDDEKKYGFFDFLADYYILILLFIIVSGSIGIYVLDKKSKFDF